MQTVQWTISREKYIKCSKINSIIGAGVMSGLALLFLAIMIVYNRNRGTSNKWWVWLIGIGVPILMLSSISFAGFFASNKWDQHDLKRSALMEQTGMDAKELANYLQAEKLKEMEGAARISAASRIGGGYGNRSSQNGEGLNFGGVQIPISKITNLFNTK